MKYNIETVKSLSLEELRDAIKEPEVCKLISNLRLRGIEGTDSWGSCSKILMRALYNMALNSSETQTTISQAAVMCLDNRYDLTKAIFYLTKEDTKIVKKYIEALDRSLYKIDKILEVLFKMQVLFAVKCYGACRDYLSKFECALDAWLDLILHCDSILYEDRFAYITKVAYGNISEDLINDSGKSPARLPGFIVRSIEIRKGDIIEANDVRYYVARRESFGDEAKIYCIKDPRENKLDGFSLRAGNGTISMREGWLPCGSNEVTLIGNESQVFVQNERIIPHDISKGDIVSIYGRSYVVKECEENRSFTFEAGNSEVLTMSAEEVLYNDNIVVTSSIKIPPKKDTIKVIYRSGYLEVHPEDDISFSYGFNNQRMLCKVVFSTDFGAYGVVIKDIFVPLYMLNNITIIK